MSVPQTRPARQQHTHTNSQKSNLPRCTLTYTDMQIQTQTADLHWKRHQGGGILNHGMVVLIPVHSTIPRTQITHRCTHLPSPAQTGATSSSAHTCNCVVLVISKHSPQIQRVAWERAELKHTGVVGWGSGADSMPNTAKSNQIQKKPKQRPHIPVRRRFLKDH